MSEIANPHPNDPRKRQRSNALTELLARCPEHLFSTDDDELAPIAGTGSDSDSDTIDLVKAA